MRIPRVLRRAEHKNKYSRLRAIICDELKQHEGQGGVTVMDTSSTYERAWGDYSVEARARRVGFQVR